LKVRPKFMTPKQYARLSDWLKSKGLTAEDFDECIHYIAGVPLITTTENAVEKEKPSSLPLKERTRQTQ